MNQALFLSCLADRTRLGLLNALQAGEACVNDLAAATGHSQSNVSHHLRQLRDCGLVAFDRDGKRNVYRLAHPAIGEVLSAADRAAEALAPLCHCEVCQ